MQVGGSSPSLNDIFASASGAQQRGAAIDALRTADAQVRAQAAQSVARGADGAATVTTQFTYTTGPDGQLYVTGATVSTSKRTAGMRDPLTPLAEQDSAGSLQPTLQYQSGPRSLSDILKPKASLSPSDEAAIFGSEEFLEDTLNSNEATYLSRLQMADFGVRAQEGQHFRAAMGLGSAPEYDYEIGPDGKLYAVAGHVDVQPGMASSDEEAARDAATIARAALAATDVSAQDVAVARDAQSKAASVYARNNHIVDHERPLLQMVG